MFHSPTSETKQQGNSTRMSQSADFSARVPFGYAPARGQLARLHSTYGNQAMLRMLSQPVPPIQTKLAVNKPGDEFEQEADRAADQVMRMTAPPSIQRKCSGCEEEEKVQRKCAECEEEEKKTGLQRKESSAGPQFAPPSVHAVLNSPGRPLDPATRSFMELRFGHDFSGVRVHTDASSADSARAVNALAYAVGPHLVFDQQQYAPETTSGRRLLAHELTHTLQQAGLTTPHCVQPGMAPLHIQRQPAQPKGEGAPSTPGEHDVNGPLTNPRFVGDPKLEQVAAGQGIVAVGSFGPAVARIQQALTDLGFDLPKYGVDCDFGGETQKAVHDFQEQQEAKLREGAVGKETIHLLDQQAPRKEFESPSCPERKQPAKKKEEPKYEGPCRFAVEDQEFGDADCAKCGGGKNIQWMRIRAEGKDCPVDLSGKKFNETIRVISKTCPGGIAQGLMCETTRDGTIQAEQGGPCLDQYLLCPTFAEISQSPLFPMYPLPECETTVEQVLKFDGEAVKVRTITVQIFVPDPFTPKCYAIVKYTQ